MKRILAGAAALMMVISAAGCSSTDTGSEKETEKETTTTAAAAEKDDAEGEDGDKNDAETEAPEETKAPEETEEPSADSEKSPAETEKTDTADDKETKAVTGALPDDFDAQLESMIASAEAEIPEINIDLSGFDNIGKDTGKDKTTTTTAAAKDDKPVTTTTAKTETPAASSTDSDSPFKFVFDGTNYDVTEFDSKEAATPSGWTKNTSASSGKQFEKDSYTKCYVVKGGSEAMFSIGIAISSGETAYPPLQLADGLTWGASVDDLKKVFGTPDDTGDSDMHGTHNTNLFYYADDGSLVVFSVSDDWGLITINCFGK